MNPKFNVQLLPHAIEFLDQLPDKPIEKKQKDTQTINNKGRRNKEIFHRKCKRRKMKKEKIKTVSLDTMIDKHIGKKGTAKRDAFDNELRMDLLGEAIKETRKAKNLTQEQLGAMMGVQKAQISKIENSIKNARFETILRAFEALEARVYFQVEF